MNYDVEMIEAHYSPDIRLFPTVSAEFEAWAEENAIQLVCSDDLTARYILWRRPHFQNIPMPPIFIGQPELIFKVFITFRFERDALLYKMTFHG